MFTIAGFKKTIALGLLVSFAFFPAQVLQDEEKKEWFPFYIPWNYCEGSKVDVSFLLDAPAGKHGFLSVKNGHFYFEDGTRIRFWGLNIHSEKACFPTHGQAEDIAKRLAQLGCNIVRMHFLDNEAPRGIIDGSRDDSQHFSDSQMDRLDYFIYQLKENGIYACFDVLGLGVRRFKAGDDVEEFNMIKPGARGISFFNGRIIELSKKFALDFLSHVNPYTGNTYLDEPAIAMVEMTNENSLFLEGLESYFPPYYKKKMQESWEKWLGEKGKGRDSIKGGWAEDREFLFELQNQYQKDMYKYLRSIGVKVPIGSSNWPYDNLNLAADAHMDFIDIHVYWDLSDKLDKIHNRPLIMQSHLNPLTMVNTMARAAVHNKPLVSTEWGSVWPNDWRAVDILSTVSYACLNDWDGLFLYAYNGGWDMSWEGLKKKLYYGTVIFNDPAKMGLFPIAGLIFLRGDIRQASYAYEVSYDINGLFDAEDMRQDRLRLAGIPYVSKLEKNFYDAKDERSDSEIRYPDIKGVSIKNKKVASDTAELIRDSEKGIFILRTPKTFSFSGFVGRQKTEEFSGIRFSTDSTFATLTITSLDGKDMSKSKHLLLSVVGRVRNKGQGFTPHITKESGDLKRDVYILNRGDEPILVEDIDAEIFIKRRKRKEGIEAYGLDENGLRKSELPVKSDRDGHAFSVSGKHGTIYYEIVRK